MQVLIAKIATTHKILVTQSLSFPPSKNYHVYVIQGQYKYSHWQGKSAVHSTLGHINRVVEDARGNLTMNIQVFLIISWTENVFTAHITFTESYIGWLVVLRIYVAWVVL